jgi:hypothetical protein
MHFFNQPKFEKVQNCFEPFEFRFFFKSSLNCAAQHCATRARMTVPHRYPVSLSFYLAPRPLPPVPASPRSRPSVTLTPSPTPATLPCSCGNGAAHARWSGAIASHPKLPTTALGPPLLLLPPPRGRARRAPFPSSFCPRHRAAFKTKRQPLLVPHFALFSSHPRPSHQS